MSLNQSRYAWISLSPIPFRDLERDEAPDGWRATSDRPQFFVDLDGLAISGWIQVELDIEFFEATHLPRVFWDESVGLGEPMSCLMLALPNGRMGCTLYAQRPVQALHIAPTNVESRFRLKSMRLRRTSVQAAFISLMRPYFAQILKAPKYYWRFARDLFLLRQMSGLPALHQVMLELIATQSEALVRQYVNQRLALGRRNQGSVEKPVNGDPEQNSQDGRLRIAIGLIEDFGDIVACEPVVRYVRQLYPNAEISWMVREIYREIVDSHPGIDHTVSVECLTDWMKWRGHADFDRIIDLHLNGRICQKCRIPLVKSVGDLSITRKNHLKQGSLLQAFCKSAGLPLLDEKPRVYISDLARKMVDELSLPERYVVFHTKSNSYQKDWSYAHWTELARNLIQQGYLVVEIGLAANVHNVGTGYLDLCGKTSLLEVAEIVRRATLLVGVESGPGHFANAVGTRAVIIIGKFSRFKFYDPYSGNSGKGNLIRFARNHRGTASVLAFEPVMEVVAQVLTEIA